MREKKYDCSKCNYRDRTIYFCGFCMKRLLDEMKEAKVKNGKQSNISNQIKSS